MNFAKKDFKVGGESIACVSYFGFPDKIGKQAIEARERLEKEFS
jgi:myo-inositol catabolism protein IolH